MGSALHGIAQEAPPPGWVPWMYMIYPLESWLTDYERILDAWAAGVVRGIVIGPLRFWDGPPSFDFTYRRAGAVIQTFAPDPAVYRRFDIDPPEGVRLDPAKEKQLQQGPLDNIAKRGWEIMMFGPGHYGRARAGNPDPVGARALAAGVEDTLRAFPQAASVIIDGAGEHHYYPKHYYWHRGFDGMYGTVARWRVSRTKRHSKAGGREAQRRPLALFARAAEQGNGFRTKLIHGCRRRS